MNDVIDQLVEMGALADVRRESGDRDHQAIVAGLLTALRPSVLRFARVMEGRLRENDDKGGWEHDMPQWLIGRVRDEVQELDDAVEAVRGSGGDDGRDEAVWREAADAANFTMMVAKVATDSVYPDRGSVCC